jgi:hypothetical protein
MAQKDDLFDNAINKYLEVLKLKNVDEDIGKENYKIDIKNNYFFLLKLIYLYKIKVEYDGDESIINIKNSYIGIPDNIKNDIDDIDDDNEEEEDIHVKHLEHHINNNNNDDDNEEEEYNREDIRLKHLEHHINNDDDNDEEEEL